MTGPSELDISRLHIGQVNSHPRKLAHDQPHGGPAIPELFGLLRQPLGHHVIGILGAFIEIRPRKVEYEGRRNDRHFDHPQFVVRAEQSRDLEPHYFYGMTRMQPQIDIALALIQRFEPQNLDRRLAARRQHDTIEPKAQLVLDNDPLLRGIPTSPSQHIFPRAIMSHSIATAYSSTVQLELHALGRIFPLAEIGPDSVYLREPAAIPPCEAEVIMTIDGRQRTWRVDLPDGLSLSSRLATTQPRPNRTNAAAG